MELELHQLELRYEGLKCRCAARERRLIASLAELGQQVPIVVVAGDGERFVVIDGHKRVRALRRLGRDTVQALAWQLEESGLGAYFMFVMSSADYVLRKPHPVLFQTACRKLELDPASVWYVGDKPEFDVAGAANAGLVSVLYAPADVAGSGPVPDLRVGSWNELRAAVSEALAEP